MMRPQNSPAPLSPLLQTPTPRQEIQNNPQTLEHTFEEPISSHCLSVFVSPPEHLMIHNPLLANAMNVRCMRILNLNKH